MSCSKFVYPSAYAASVCISIPHTMQSDFEPVVSETSYETEILMIPATWKKGPHSGSLHRNNRRSRAFPPCTRFRATVGWPSPFFDDTDDSTIDNVESVYTNCSPNWACGRPNRSGHWRACPMQHLTSTALDKKWRTESDPTQLCLKQVRLFAYTIIGKLLL